MKSATIRFGKTSEDEHVIGVFNSMGQDQLVPVDPEHWDSLQGSTAERITHILGWTNTEHDGEHVHFALTTKPEPAPRKPIADNNDAKPIKSLFPGSHSCLPGQSDLFGE